MAAVKRCSCFLSQNSLPHLPAQNPYAHKVGQRPSDRHRYPDSDNADLWDGRQHIGQNNARAQREDGQDDRHPRLADCPVIAIEQEEQADAALKGGLNVQVLDADGQNLDF